MPGTHLSTDHIIASSRATLERRIEKRMHQIRAVGGHICDVKQTDDAEPGERRHAFVYYEVQSTQIL